MAMNRSQVDFVRLDNLLRELPRQMPFAIASTLTALAKDGQAAANDEIDKVFDRPVPFTRRSVGITPARKSNLVAAVFVKDIQAQYLGIQVTGGTRLPKSGSPIIVPVQIRLNQAGNIPRGKLKRELAKPTTFVVGKNAKGEGARLPPGIYQRPKRTKRGKAGKTKMLVAFEPKARYRRRFPFKRVVSERVLVMARRRWRENVVRAIKTARARS